MKKILFCSHGRLCEGMLDTLKVFSLYDPQTMTAIPFYTEENDGELRLDQYIAELHPEDAVLVFTDVAFGSVSQTLMLKLGERENVTILAGMNLMLVLELAGCDFPLALPLIEEKIQSARASILDTRSLKMELNEEDE